ncbi:hypothetical protein [Kitasatospora cheerisanensis]|uniref:hypothetical protein n=1 Tax=Kitasatospora cheerisanensis TaxID=81942 RepID=UPI0012EE8945|nr:hypothetical protein [Kitasatospora cheerisanensis]
MLTPLALLGLGALSADPDRAALADPARLAVLAAALLALLLLRTEWRRLTAAALLGFLLLALPVAATGSAVRHLRGERTELVLTVGFLVLGAARRGPTHRHLPGAPEHSAPCAQPIARTARSEGRRPNG